MTDKPTAAQGTLIESEEDLSWALADLVPAASKILDSTATYLSKVGKKIGDEKSPLTPNQLRVLVKSNNLAQQIVKLSSEINLMLRKPNQWLLDDAKQHAKQNEEEAQDVPLIDESGMVESELVDEDQG